MSGTPQIFSPYANLHTKVDLGVIGEAFTLFKEQAVTWIIAMIIVGVVNGVMYVLSQSLISSALHGAVSLPVMMFFNAVRAIVNMLLAIGLVGMAVNQIRGESISAFDLFDFVDVAWQAIVASFLLWIVISIATAICFIPGLIAGGLLMFTFPLIADQKMNPVGALSSSYNALSDQWFMAAVFYVAVSFVGTVGIAIFGVGVLVTVPVAVLSVTLLYHNFYFGAPDNDTNSSGGFDPALPS